jgi:hypothetical protein
MLLVVPAIAAKVGIFDAHQDVGAVSKKGNAKYDRKRDRYTITGDGANIWGNQDAFQYAYKQVSGDISLTTGISWVGKGSVGHRKAGIMLRQGLTADAPYADVMVHGDGLTSLQYRLTSGGTTSEMRSEVKAPAVIRIERKGDQITIGAGDTVDDLKTTGPLTLHLQDPIYVGFAVSSHAPNVTETAIFSSLKITSARQ